MRIIYLILLLSIACYAEPRRPYSITKPDGTVNNNELQLLLENYYNELISLKPKVTSTVPSDVAEGSMVFYNVKGSTDCFMYFSVNGSTFSVRLNP